MRNLYKNEQNKYLKLALKTVVCEVKKKVSPEFLCIYFDKE